MYDEIKLGLAGLIAVVFVLTALSRRFPHVVWLRPFRNAFPRPSEAEREKARRRSNVYAGAELILLGLSLPLLYGVTTVMFFNDFTTTATTIVLASSVVCIGLGVAAIRHGRR